MPASALRKNRPSNELERLLGEIAACRACAAHLAHEPRPVVRVSEKARILIVGQAPGRLVHETGLPWNDPSGDRLREWMGLDRDRFYDMDNVAVAAMGFCFPGTVNGVDLPPRKECAPLWRPRLLPLLKGVRLTLIVGSYAHRYHAKALAGANMTETVANWRAFPENELSLPHPSWRNTAWLKKNPWFEEELVPVLRARVKRALR
jgi:uracil-DNA glycosylase